MWFSEQGSGLYSRYNLHMRWTVKVSWKKENLVIEYCYRVPVGFDFSFYSSKVDLEKVDWQWKYDREGIFLFVCSTYELYLTVLWHESVKHTVIKHCNNKKEQGENNVLFYDCACSYLGGKKLFISFTVNSQCPTHLEGIMKVNCVWSFQYYCSAE